MFLLKTLATTLGRYTQQAVSNLNRLLERDIPLYPTLKQFYSELSADLVIISSPIQYHSSQTCLALSKENHVLCEKPLSPTVDAALKMIEARDEAKKLVAI